MPLLLCCVSGGIVWSDVVGLGLLEAAAVGVAAFGVILAGTYALVRAQRRRARRNGIEVRR